LTPSAMRSETGILNGMHWLLRLDIKRRHPDSNWSETRFPLCQALQVVPH